MTKVINVHEAKTHLSRLLDKAHAGEEIVLGKAGKPYARLVPLEKPVVRRMPGRLDGVLDPRFFDLLRQKNWMSGKAGEAAARYPRAALVVTRPSKALPDRPTAHRRGRK